ncbi:MAG: hypothetical protein R2695_05370 [Acidimicrobiales bacterium]
MFLVDDYDGERYRVLLPVRPNGRTGGYWPTPSTSTVTTSRSGSSSTTTASRCSTTPTRSSRRLSASPGRTPHPEGPLLHHRAPSAARPEHGIRVFAYGLSGYSDTFTTFALRSRTTRDPRNQ